MNFEKAVGEVFGFYGIDGNTFKLGGHVFEAVEDENDGYRSMLGEVATRDNPSGLIFFKRSIAKVKVVETNNSHEFVGYELVDVEDGHVWLRLGTDEYDDYYPCFIFSYQPKKA